MNKKYLHQLQDSLIFELVEIANKKNDSLREIILNHLTETYLNKGFFFSCNKFKKEVFPEKKLFKNDDLNYYVNLFYAEFLKCLKYNITPKENIVLIEALDRISGFERDLPKYWEETK